MKYKILIIAAFSLLFQGCDDFLDVKPKGVSIPEKAEEYEQLLNYQQMTKASECYMCYMTDDAYVPDKGYAGFEEMAISDRNLYTFQSEVFGPAEWDILWLQGYNRIYYTNVVINQIMSSQGDLDYKNRVRADAYVMRAFDYLTLVNAYAKHYDKATAATDPGVPLQLNENITNAPITRVSVQRIYDQIKADLEEAEKYLPENNLLPYRGSKGFALGMAARMYLYMGEYDMALQKAEEALQLNHEVLDLTQLSVADPDKEVGRTDYPEADENPENINIRFTPYVYGLSGAVFGSEDLLRLFSEKDMRYQLYFTHKIGSNVVEDLIWAPFIPMNVSSSVPEMLLIAAECYARKNDKTSAMKRLNQLMKYRIKDFTEETAADTEEALRKVLDERRREFAFNSMFRLVDLKRLNKDPRFRKTITHTVAGQTYTLEPESPKYVLPIPIMVTDMNPGMQKNER